MPCVSVSNNRARKASVKAAATERKINRENTRLAKKQQSTAAKLTAKTAAEAARIEAKSAAQAAKTAKIQAKADAKAQKVRQSLEKRVTKKHQAHRAKTKAARAKTLKTETKLAAKATKTATRTAAKLAKTQSRTAKVNHLKTSLKKVKFPQPTLPQPTLPQPTRPQLKPAVSKTLSKLSAAKSARAQVRAAAKAAKISAKKQIKSRQSQAHAAEASRVAKISGATVQSSFKIPHHPANTPASAPAYTPVYTPKPLRRTAFMTRGDLINAESRLGSTIFGPVPAGHRREFFHDQDNIWIWFESWHDGPDHPRQLTVRYEVRPSGVYKKISAGAYFKLTGDELENFRRATHAYLHIVKKYLYPNVSSAK